MQSLPSLFASPPTVKEPLMMVHLPPVRTLMALLLPPEPPSTLPSPVMVRSPFTSIAVAFDVGLVSDFPLRSIVTVLPCGMVRVEEMSIFSFKITSSPLASAVLRAVASATSSGSFTVPLPFHVVSSISQGRISVLITASVPRRNSRL